MEKQNTPQTKGSPDHSGVFEIFPGIAINPEKLAATLEGLAYLARTVIPNINNTMTPGINGTASKAVPETEVKTTGKPDFSNPINPPDNTALKPEPDEVPEDQIDFSPRLDIIKKIESDPDLSLYLQAFTRREYWHFLKGYAHETKTKVGNEKKWSEELEINPNLAQELLKGKGLVAELLKSFKGIFGTTLNQALNEGKLEQKKMKEVDKHDFPTNLGIQEALAEISNFKENFILAKAFFAYIESLAPKRRKGVFINSLGFLSTLPNQFKQNPPTRFAYLTVEKAIQAAHILGLRLEEVIAKGLEITKEKLGDFPPAPIADPDPPASHDSEDVEAPLPRDENSDPPTKPKPEPNPDPEPTDELEKEDLEPGLDANNDLAKDSENKDLDSESKEADYKITGEEQKNLGRFLNWQKEAWIKANNSDEQSFFSQHGIKKGWFMRVCDGRRKIKVSEAIGLIMNISKEYSLDDILAGNFSTDSNKVDDVPTPEKKPTDLLNEIEKRALKEYVVDLMTDDERMKARFLKEINGQDITRRRAEIIVKAVDRDEELDEVLRCVPAEA